MPQEAAHKSRWETFEVVFGAPLLVSIVIQWIAPLSVSQGMVRWAFISVGLMLMAVGVSVVVLARRELARYRQPTDPGWPTSRMVTSGVFSVSRNPLYLGGIIVLVGLALLLNLLWFLVILIPSLIVCHYVLIVPEERYLTAKFGEEYQTYAAAVHRWLGRKRITH
jgi:protein-S-isoprenylcysteine O-methyltransferase Ste14